MTTHATNSSILNRRSVRIALVAATATYLFLVCAAFMSREPATPQESLAVFGPNIVRAGSTFPVRVIGFEHDSGRHGISSVSRAWVETAAGKTALNLSESHEGKPGWVHLSPVPSLTGPMDLMLELDTSSGSKRVVQAPLTIYDSPLIVWPVPHSLPSQVPKQELQIDILTEGPGLALQMLNRVWIRVTDTAGNAVSGAKVDWQVSGATPPAGVVETNVAGVAAIEIMPNNLSTRFTIDASNGERTGHQEQTEQPLGRSAIIRTSRLVQAADERPISLAIVQSEDGDIYCDLLLDDAWIRTWHLTTKNGEPPVVTVDLEAEGVYRFQCYSHFAKPGDGADALYLFRTEGSRLDLMKSLLRMTASGRTGTYRKNAPVVGPAAVQALLAGYRTKEVDVTAPTLLANTRKDDVIAARDVNDRTRARFLMLIGASFGMVILWAFYIGVQSAIEGRVRLAEAISDLGEMAVDVGPLTGLTRMRNAIQVLLVIFALGLNVVGMLALFQYM
jgi:hypothetical protein